MFARMANGWALARSSWEVLKLDKEMLVFPLCSGLACLLVLVSFGLPLYNSEYAVVLKEEEGLPEDPVVYLIAFAFYFANYFVITFFNAGLVACAVIRFRGGDPTVSDGFRAAFLRMPQILTWSLVSATVGVVLRIIQSRSGKLGRIAAGLVGIIWGIATYFVVPVLVVEKVGPFEAVRRSAGILRRSWGETLVANFGIGLIIFLCILASAVPAVIGALLGGAVAVTAGVTLTVVLIVLISLVSSALNTIIVAALYEYARGASAPPQFSRERLQHAFAPE